MKKSNQSVLSIGVTGGIGAGKTTACRIFESLGAEVIYADTLAKKLINTDEEIKKKILRTFGAEMYNADGSFDAQRMGKLIFSDEKWRGRLNAIVHPHVIHFIRKRIQKKKESKSGGVVVVEAAIIYEAKIENIFDYIVVVDAGKRERLERLRKRDNASKADIIQRFKAQLSSTLKVERADFVLHNFEDKKQFEQNCRFLYMLLVQFQPFDRH